MIRTPHRLVRHWRRMRSCSPMHAAGNGHPLANTSGIGLPTGPAVWISVESRRRATITNANHAASVAERPLDTARRFAMACVLTATGATPGVDTQCTTRATADLGPRITPRAYRLAH